MIHRLRGLKVCSEEICSSLPMIPRVEALEEVALLRSSSECGIAFL
jgi:hypothetical protein